MVWTRSASILYIEWGLSENKIGKRDKMLNTSLGKDDRMNV